MDTNASDSGSRVTRLRKRLTSVDSDNSSRPGTPVPSKLISISEISASPSRATRMTRRNSTSGVATPVKTPGKRAIAATATIAENGESLTPARRSTRRRSVSVYENEETLQATVKVPLISTLQEEHTPSGQKLSRLTRSQSKSPKEIQSSKVSPSPDGNKNGNLDLHSKSPKKIQPPKEILDYKQCELPNGNKNKELENHTIKTDIQKRKKPGPKSKTRDRDDLSDVEVSILENEMEEIKNKSSNILTIVLTDDDVSQTTLGKKDDDISEDNPKPISDATNNSVEKEKNEISNVNSTDTNSESKNSNGCDATKKIPNVNNADTNSESNNCDESLQKEDSKLTQNVAENSSLNMEELQIEKATTESTSKFCKNKENINQEENSIISIEIVDETMDEQIEKELIVEPKISNSTEENLQCVTLDDSRDNVVLNIQATTEEIKKNEIESDENAMQENEVNSLPIAETDVEDINPINISDKVDFTTPKNKGHLSASAEIATATTSSSYYEDEKENLNESTRQTNLKKVGFLSSPSNDMTIKNIYPKTPASAKIYNSSLINLVGDDSSFQSEKNTLQIHSDNRQDPTPNSDNKSDDDKLGDPTELRLTPPSRTLKCTRLLEKVNSSTPINIDPSTPDREDKKEINNSEDKTNCIANSVNSSPNANKEVMKWINPSVKGISTEGSKLDTVVSQKDADVSQCDKNDSFVEQVKSNKKKSIIFSSDEEDDEIHRDDKDEVEDHEAECELATGEKPYERKHDFHDDEAMEVDDYESGDSMDSEERREYEENEIPIDGESIGSHTTDDEREEYVEEENSDNTDSFIVSDNDELECSVSNDDEEMLDEDKIEPSRKKKNTYKRLKQPVDGTSSSDEEVETLQKPGNIKQQSPTEKKSDSEDIKNDCTENDNNLLKPKSESNLGDLLNKSKENIMLDSSKLSDSALRLQCTAESESEEDVNEKNMNISRKEILRKLNQSDRFNKSVRDLNLEVDTSPLELETVTSNNIECESNDEKLEFSDNESTTSKSSEEHQIKERQSETLLGEDSLTSDSDIEKENNSLSMPQRRNLGSGLSVSFGNYKKLKKNYKKQEWQRSFTIDVTVKGEEMQAAISDVKLQNKSPSEEESSSSTNEPTNDELKDEDAVYLDNMKHMPLPLGNPLIRTRRQSLALPTNPDMEICSHGGGAAKNIKRKSLGLLSSNDFNPSQSFVDSIERHKNEHTQQVVKRKRLSKSFCGAAEALDNSVIDIDVRHLHKRSKLTNENSMAESHHDSIENINTSKLSTKFSSTPHEKAAKNDSNNNIQRILSRCDEILEAANRAKLESKINNKKSKVKIHKKSRKISKLTSPEETTQDEVLRRVSKEIKRKDKTKSALSQALKAADVILGKKKPTQSDVVKQDQEESKRLPVEVLEAIDESSSMKRKCKKDKKQCVHTKSTSAGTFTEMLQTPEKKKKKPTYIQLPTGKVSIEPVTPKKHCVLAFNGDEFRESPITPHETGFKVKKIALTESNESSSSTALKNGKRKRFHYDGTSKMQTLHKSHWTQSGLFIEEDIPKNPRIDKYACEKLKYRNFKENAIMRPDIKRSTKREILLLKERR